MPSPAASSTEASTPLRVADPPDATDSTESRERHDSTDQERCAVRHIILALGGRRC
jgi:hypothetical protein